MSTGGASPTSLAHNHSGEEMDMKRFTIEGILATDSKNNFVEIVRWFGGDGARQRAEKLAGKLHTGAVWTIDELAWDNKPACSLVPGTSVPVSHCVVIEAEYA